MIDCIDTGYLQWLQKLYEMHVNSHKLLGHQLKVGTRSHDGSHTLLSETQQAWVTRCILSMGCLQPISPDDSTTFQT